MEIRKTSLGLENYLEFCKRCMFKSNDDVDAAIVLAYSDMQRTMHGIKHLKDAKESMKKEMQLCLRNNIEALSHNIMNQDKFDRWHFQVSDKLKKLVVETLEKNKEKGKLAFYFTYGQAQIWINMTLKYLSVFHHSEYESVYEYFHVPLDHYVLNDIAYDIVQFLPDRSSDSSSRIVVAGKKYKDIKSVIQSGKIKDFAWSRWDDYQEYLDVQKAFRNFCKEIIPMDKEFEIWNRIAREQQLQQ